MKGGPSLHREDAVLFEKGYLKPAQVYTLRPGEMVRNLDETLMEIEHDMVKIAGQGEGWTCLFFGGPEEGCRIYEHRPVECRALKCWDSRDLREVMARPYLQRRDVVNPGDGILKLMAAHEQRCHYEVLKSALNGLHGPNPDKAAEEIIDLLKYDDFMRSFLAEKLALDPKTMDFFFGRPLTITIRLFGLRLKQDGDTFLLETIQPSD